MQLYAENAPKICLAAGLCPDPLGELMRCPDPLTAMGVYFYNQLRPTITRRQSAVTRRKTSASLLFIQFCRLALTVSATALFHYERVIARIENKKKTLTHQRRIIGRNVSSFTVLYCRLKHKAVWVMLALAAWQSGYRLSTHEQR